MSELFLGVEMHKPRTMDICDGLGIRRAMILGVTGQDGSYLSELLLSKGYSVIGVNRRSSVDNTARLYTSKNHTNFTLVEGDITDASSMSGLVAEYEPHELYNLAAQSHVATSFKQPSYTFDVCARGVLNVLEAVRVHSPKTRIYQASTSEMFGNNYHVVETGGKTIRYQDETVQMVPTSPYAVAKTAAHHLIDTYRRGYGLYASAGILFNHESERRGENFVTRKITRWIGRFKAWLPDTGFLHPKDGVFYSSPSNQVGFPMLRLGNIDSARDWGYAPDFVRAMWMMLQEDNPDDYVIATGMAFTVRQFLEVAFNAAFDTEKAGINYEDCIYIDPAFVRPSELSYLCGNARKANLHLKWKPQVTFKEMVERMVSFDTALALRELG